MYIKYKKYLRISFFSILIGSIFIDVINFIIKKISVIIKSKVWSARNLEFTHFKLALRFIL